MDSYPTATVMLDRERTMRMDPKAMRDFEAMTGKGLPESPADWGALSWGELRILIWACLVQEDESLTVRDVGALMSHHHLFAGRNDVGWALEALFHRKVRVE